MDDPHSYKTPPELARKYRVKPSKILQFIAAELLDAVNVASPTSRRPQWRISPAAIADFELSRSARQPAKPVRRKRRRVASDPAFIEYF